LPNERETAAELGAARVPCGGHRSLNVENKPPSTRLKPVEGHRASDRREQRRGAGGASIPRDGAPTRAAMA